MWSVMACSSSCAAVLLARVAALATCAFTAVCCCDMAPALSAFRPTTFVIALATATSAFRLYLEVI